MSIVSAISVSLKLRRGWPIRPKKLVGAALSEFKRGTKNRRKREAKEKRKSTDWRRLRGSGLAGRSHR